VLGEIRKRFPDMRVLLTTAHSDAEAQDLCGQYGGTRLLLKPYNAQVLAENVKAALAGN
jgi:DNA-binding NarL/FixJ family response regulator